MKDDGDSLTINRLRLRNFRSYRDYELDDIGPLTLFVGPNASGKTNIIEGIQLLTSTTSFRSSRSTDFISWGADQAVLDAHLSSSSRRLEVTAIIDDGRKTWRLNGKAKHRQDIQGILPCVTFSPDDLLMVKGSNVHRRDAVDALGCQLTRNYRIIKRDYEKLLRHKHALLDEGIGGVYLESVNETIVPVATQLCLNRYALLRNLIGKMSDIYRDLTGAIDSNEVLTQLVVPSWHRDIPDSEFYYDRRSDDLRCRDVSNGVLSVQAGSADLNDGSGNNVGFGADDVFEDTCENLDKVTIERELRQAFVRFSEEEQRRKRCLVGPQADRIFFYVNGRSATHFASQGQQRSAVLAWKIAEVRIIQEVLGTRPVLLLDDVTSELDASRRTALMALVAENTQTFMTTTDVAGIDPRVVERARVVDLGRRD